MKVNQQSFASVVTVLEKENLEADIQVTRLSSYRLKITTLLSCLCNQDEFVELVLCHLCFDRLFYLKELA